MLPHHRRPPQDDGGPIDARRPEEGRIDAPGQGGRIDAPVGLAWLAWALVVVAAILIPVACQAQQGRPQAMPEPSGPQFISQAAGTTIVLHAEPCALQEAVRNLYLRATWTDAGEPTIEGCWNVTRFGVVMFYFADRTVVAVPVVNFTRLGRT